MGLLSTYRNSKKNQIEKHVAFEHDSGHARIQSTRQDIVWNGEFDSYD